ncbi:hypothetical protein BLNAU_18340 [Blattamonas nauphoetae]|uniref:Uncharacterized protein n=1 Tax=Blattamonas nauphoetae TaxID=2049346 RepID=A0ABQ9X4Q0_9EUKA|nr:hypothetical protein BLNAU_18340 [Blattamonas nauphoetae]
MSFDNHSTTPQVDNAKAEQALFLEMIVSRICGDCISLRPVMLNALLVLVNDDFQTRSAIRGMKYLQAVERYCEMTSGDAVPSSLPELLCVLGRSSEDELDRICQSSIPSFLLEWMIIPNNNTLITEIGNCLLLMTSSLRSSSIFLAHHKPKFLAFINHCLNPMFSLLYSSLLPQLCLSPHPQISKLPLKVLSRQAGIAYQIHAFLQTLEIPSVSTESWSKPDTFVGRLCGMLTEHVSQIRSLFTESTPNDPTISSLSTTLPEDSPLLFRNAVLEMLCEGFSLIWNLLVGSNHIVEESLITCDFAPLLKATIVTCLDLLDLTKSGLNCVPPDHTDLLVKIIDSSWKSTTRCLMGGNSTLSQLVGNTFSDATELCSLLERTSRHSPPTCPAHLGMIAILRSKLPFLVPRTVEEKLVIRVINASNPTTVPPTHGWFHTYLINSVEQLMRRQRHAKLHKEEWNRTRMSQFQHVLKPAQQYLLFILQREEFIPNDSSSDKDLPTQIANLLMHTILLERDLFEYGEIVETGREEWEVGWLVETSSQRSLAQRLKSIGEDDERMKRDEKKRWKKRVVRRREAGHEDAVEGWLMKQDRGNRMMILKYLEYEGEESGMNTQYGKDRWR